MRPTVLTGDNLSLELDLGPLAWVFDDWRKSVDAATSALRRFVREAQLSCGSDVSARDASPLRLACQQLHQAGGILVMVGFEEPARMLRAMETLVQKFVQRPEFCSDEAVLTVERASFALTDFLEAVLKGKKLSAVALFPQYRSILALTGDDRAHPADVWAYDWRWIDVALPQTVMPLPYDSALRLRIDGYILNVVKTGHPPSALAMRDISLGFAAHQTDLNARVLWAISAAYFEALALGLCSCDVYVKRAASQVLSQYRSLARGEAAISEQRVRDLLFFCSQSVLLPTQDAPALRAVQKAYGLENSARIDYEKIQFGRFDPALLAQARKRITAAGATWSLLSGGDTGRIETAADQFSLLADSVVTLHPDNADLVAALLRSIESVQRTGTAPDAPLAMEVATAVLYLEATFEALDADSDQWVERGNRLARRLDQATSGGPPEPLDAWMQELYRRVSDRKLMGSVVDNLRSQGVSIDLGLVEVAAPVGLAAVDAMDEAPPAQTAKSETLDAQALPSADDPVKVIGALRIGVALHNAYLNEADEWSRRLLTELTEWSLELEKPVADSAVDLAHALAGSSATVGFTSLSELARALEHALEHAQLSVSGWLEQARLFVDVAEDIRRLLHQFAAGFLKQPNADLLLALKAVFETDTSTQARPQVIATDATEPHQSAPVMAAPASPALPIHGTVAKSIEDDEAIAAQDALDVDLFAAFEEEALELLPQLGAVLRQWSARPDNLGARQEALRVLHAFKDSARLAGAMRLGDMAHRMESAVGQINGQSEQGAQLNALLARFDAMAACFAQLRALPAAALVMPEAAPTVPVSDGLVAPQGKPFASSRS